MQPHKILIVGGGIGGMAAAIRLAEEGATVTLVDIDADWRVYGAGITITGPTLRAYRRLGLLDKIRSQGAITNGTRILRFDGELLRELDEPVLEEGLPATGGIMRPVLHHLMQDRVRELGIEVRLGLSVERLDPVDDSVDTVFTDGSLGRYDLVVGADSIFSGVRKLAFPHMNEPQMTGQACWRLSMDRPPAFDRGEFYLGGARPAGITACGPDSAYLWLLTPYSLEDGRMADEAIRVGLREHLAGFGGNAGWMRDNMTEESWVNFRPLAAAIQPRPWSNGRIVLIGDAVHATTPHLASGAGMAVESALVLVQELMVKGRSVEQSLAAYEEIRYERCKFVVDTSIAVGRAQLGGAGPEEVGALIGSGLHTLAEDFQKSFTTSRAA